jgi:multiple sugar transport system permease protein
LAAAAFSLVPFLMFLTVAVKSQGQVTAIPPQWWPDWSLEFFRSALQRYHVLHYLGNSLIVAGTTTVLTLGLATLAGYALARLPARLARPIMMATLVCGMFPQIAVVGPIWRFLRAVGWLNTHQGLILPYVGLTLPLAIWILAVFLRDIPVELEQAARVDGCSRLGALRRVVLPLAAPGMVTAAILIFIHAWNEFFLALLILSDPAKQTMPVGIALFQGEFTVPWGEIAAASIITTAPLVALVLLFQKRIASGLSAGAVKG